MAFITVEGKEYEIFPLTGRQGLAWPYRVAKYIRGFFPAADEKFDLQFALDSFFDNCPEAQYIEFAEGMFETVHMGGKSLRSIYDAHFTGKAPEMFKVLVAISKHHFAGFFSELESFGFSNKPPAETTSEKVTIND